MTNDGHLNLAKNLGQSLLLVWLSACSSATGLKPDGGAAPLVAPPHGLAYDPQTNAWSPLPQAPLQGRLNPAAAWTGHALIVWGGSRFGAGKPFADGAAFTPATP